MKAIFLGRQLRPSYAQRFCFSALAASLLCGSFCFGHGLGKEAAAERPVEGIMDNSFLVEEAYNQEKGVVQHIFNGFYALDRHGGPDDELWALSFTQEWPVFSQTHQFSYTIPYTFLRVGGQSENGVGDILLNYRYQAYFNPESLTAFAPRASLVLPTGDKDLLLGENTVGAQFNLPFSTTFGRRWFTHFNAGLTYLPSASSAQDRDLVHWNLGASGIYAVTRQFHLMTEWVGYWTQFGDAGENKDYEFTSFLSPGFRKAFDFAEETQLVLGVAVPIGLTRSTPEIGAFFYISFEHPFAHYEED